MPRAGPRAQTLSIFLLKDQARTEAQCLKKPGDLKKVAVTESRVKVGDLYMKQTPATPPRWLRFFADALDEKPPRLFNASNSAVLLARSGGRKFALCFGQGRHLLNPGVWEENFGLRVTLNSVDPEKLRSVDRRTFDAYSSHTRTQTSLEGNVAAFGLNIEQDLLRAATGQPVDPDLGRRMTGMDSLVVTVPTTPAQLIQLLEKFKKKFEDNSYKTTFPWVDHIAEVREAAIREKADEALLDVIRTEGASSPRAWLAVPELVEWAEIRGFRYRAAETADVFPDLEIRDFLASLPEAAALTIERLKQRRVYAVSAEDDRSIREWSVYACTYAELELNGSTYLLTNGKWYRVQRDFVEAVNRDVARLVRALPLPRYEDKSETAYNKRVADNSGGALALLDVKLIPIGGTTVEVCDLFSANREFIHVKRWGGSSVFSHLFAQGSVSANTFLQDPAFRAAFNAKLPASHRMADPSQRPNPTTYDIVYAIVSRPRVALDKELPFFSRLNLRNAARQLLGYGYKVSLVRIEAA